MDIESSSNNDMLIAPRWLPTLIAGLWIIFFSFTFLDLWQRWIQWDEALAHGIPVIAIFLYLLWKTGQWKEAHWISPKVERGVSAVALFVTSLLWFLAYAVNIQIIEQLLLLPTLVMTYAILFGWKTVFNYRVLLLFPIFAIPIWGSLNGLLLEGASLVVGALVRLIEMPALIQGNSIYIPHGHILIADGCSGLRYFVIALVLAYMMGYLNGYKEGKLLLILCIAAALGLVTNWLRIFILIVIGYQTKMESSLMADHELFGWILFGVIFLPAIYFAPVAQRPAQATPLLNTSNNSASLTVAIVLMAAGPLSSLILLASFEPASGNFERAENRAETASLIKFPAEVLSPDGGANSIEVLSERVFLRKDTYHRETLNEKLVPYLPRLYDHQHWMNTVDRMQSVGAYSLRYQELKRKADDERVAQLQWFIVGEKLTASSVQAKLWQIPATLKGQNRFTIVTLQKRCEVDNCVQAEAVLNDRAQKMLNKAPLS